MDLSDLWEWPDGPRGYLKAIDPLTGKIPRAVFLDASQFGS
jgi:alcohol dehydrogenase (cytochrome c)